ncbi:TPA: ATP-binding protein, partial [Enterococcus faecium]|nr:ATP-binding protein [Enterococcus faecium]
SLSSDESCRGMLDPLLFLPKEEAIQTAKNVLGMLGEVDTNRETASHKKTVIQDAIDVVYTMPGKHSLSQVIEEIRKSDKELAKLILGHSVGLGKILIGNEHSTPIRFDSQINVLGTQGIRIPTQKEIDSGRLNSEQLAGMAIMEVIMKFTYIFSTNKEEDAAIIYDEAKGYEDTAQ